MATPISDHGFQQPGEAVSGCLIDRVQGYAQLQPGEKRYGAVVVGDNPHRLPSGFWAAFWALVGGKELTRHQHQRGKPLLALSPPAPGEV